MKRFMCPNPYCKYLISELEKDNAPDFLTCPRCEKTLLFNFKYSRIWSYEDNDLEVKRKIKGEIK